MQGGAKDMLIWILILALAPGIFWLLYFYSRDRLEPEPRHLVVKTFLWGIAVALPVAIAEGLMAWIGAFLLIVFVGPVLEEYGKYFVVTRTVYRREEFNEPMDGIVYAVAAALGFASIENVGYLFSVEMLAPEMLGLTFWARALLSVPGHALFSSMWGYALGWGLLIEDEHERQAFIRRGLWTAIAFHGAFNLLALLGAELGLVASGFLLILIVFAWRAVHRRIASALENSQHHRSLMGFADDPQKPEAGPPS
jgi:RsiW-degrading membrane proteinase PrsW (M82 family)